MKCIFYTESVFRFNTCLGRAFYGRSLRGRDCTVDPQRHLQLSFRVGYSKMDVIKRTL